MFFTINPVGIRYTGKKGFTSFFKFGYFIGDLHLFGGELFYEIYIKSQYFYRLA